MEGFSGLRRIRGWSSHLMLDHGMMFWVLRARERKLDAHPHTLFFGSRSSSLSA